MGGGRRGSGDGTSVERAEERARSERERFAEDPSTGKVVLVPLDPPAATDATTVLAPTVVTVPRARAAASTTGMGVTSSPLDLEDERARALAEKLARADALQQGEYQERLERRLSDALDKLGTLTPIAIQPRRAL